MLDKSNQVWRLVASAEDSESSAVNWETMAYSSVQAREKNIHVLEQCLWNMVLILVMAFSMHQAWDHVQGCIYMVM